jgi:hypothetical protein
MKRFFPVQSLAPVTDSMYMSSDVMTVLSKQQNILMKLN